MAPLKHGSDSHKRLFCREFLDTHLEFEVESLPWPELDESGRARLSGLPVWEEAVSTEAETAMKVQAYAAVEPDPLLRKAIGMQGDEEGRHAEILRVLTRRYEIPVEPRPVPPSPADPLAAFLRVGYAECFDSFFAFGLFALARDSGFFPPALVRLFEPILQEEARHILFHANWVASRQARAGAMQQAVFLLRRALAVWLQIAKRLRTALDLGGSRVPRQKHFTMKAHSSLGDLSPSRFLRLCLAENERRLGVYDDRLLRPTLVPWLARAFLRWVPSSAAAPGGPEAGFASAGEGRGEPHTRSRQRGPL